MQIGTSKKLILWLTAASVCLGQGSVINGSFNVQYANASSTGTAIYNLAKFTGAPSTVVISSTSDTSGVIGIVVAGAGTSGSAQVAVSGNAPCIFDGATTANHYVQISTTTNGYCHDTGSTTYPTTGQVIGVVTTTNGSGGIYSVDLTLRQATASGGGSYSQGAGILISGTTISADPTYLAKLTTVQAGTPVNVTVTSTTCSTPPCNVTASTFSGSLGAYVDGMYVTIKANSTYMSTLALDSIGGTAPNVYDATGTTTPLTTVSGNYYLLMYNASLNASAGGWQIASGGASTPFTSYQKTTSGLAVSGGSDQTLYSVSLPALAAGACFAVEWGWSSATQSSGLTTKFKVGSTVISHPYDAAYFYMLMGTFKYCNNPGTQTTQSVYYTLFGGNNGGQTGLINPFPLIDNNGTSGYTENPAAGVNMSTAQTLTMTVAQTSAITIYGLWFNVYLVQ